MDVWSVLTRPRSASTNTTTPSTTAATPPSSPTKPDPLPSTAPLNELLLSEFDPMATEQTSVGSPPKPSTLPNGAAPATGGTAPLTAALDLDDRNKEPKFSFQRFLELWRRPESEAVNMRTLQFCQTLISKSLTSNKQSDSVQSFYVSIASELRSIPLWRSCNEAEFELAIEGVEKVIMNKIHDKVFSPSLDDDAGRDDVLRQKMLLFRWIEVQHLDIKPHPYNDHYFQNAAIELNKLNKFKAPRDKLICILNTCKCIMTLLRKLGMESNADSFLPMLIYTVIKANPQKLVSNVQYITRYRGQNRLRAESAYYFTNLLGAISFIESIDAKSLTITQEEFDWRIEQTVKELDEEERMQAEEASQTTVEEQVIAVGDDSASTAPPDETVMLSTNTPAPTVASTTAVTAVTPSQPTSTTTSSSILQTMWGTVNKLPFGGSGLASPAGGSSAPKATTTPGRAPSPPRPSTNTTTLSVDQPQPPPASSTPQDRLMSSREQALREEEDLQLAMALSMSEAENARAEELERLAHALEDSSTVAAPGHVYEEL